MLTPKDIDKALQDAFTDLHEAHFALPRLGEVEEETVRVYWRAL